LEPSSIPDGCPNNQSDLIMIRKTTHD
jgi:hypothetical protein